MIKDLFEKTPGRRFAVAFWLGYLFHLTTYFGVSSFINDMIVASIVFFVCSAGIVIIWTRNKIRFEQEHMWMTLKTSGPKEEDDPLPTWYAPSKPNVSPPKSK